jgi:hypothetical protein
MNPEPTGVMPGPAPGEERPLRDLLVELWENAEQLVRQELALASAELDTKVARVKVELAKAAVAAGLLFAAFLALTAAVVLLLALVLPAWAAALIVAGVAGGGGYLLLQRTREGLDLDALKPERTLRSVQKDVQMFKEATK